MSSGVIDLPSALFFNPQSKATPAPYLSKLKTFLCNHQSLRPIVKTIEALPETWKLVATQRSQFSSLSQGPSCTQALSDWITGVKDAASFGNGASACLALPLLTIIQSCQYFQFLQTQSIRHERMLQALQRGAGIHGYCAGLLPAVAIASSANETELVENICRAIRVALAIGANADLGDEDPSGGPTNIVVRLKGEGQGDRIVEKFPGAYISAVTDPKTISIVGPARVLSEIQAYASGEGIQSQGMHIRGKVHNPENETLATALCSFCEQHSELRYSESSTLKVTIRSNRNAQRLSSRSLTDEVIRTILSSRCNWYDLLKGVSRDLADTGLQAHILLNFGMGDCLSPVPFLQDGVQISKREARSVIDECSPEITNSEYGYPPNAVAVIGMACRFPGADDVEQLWDLLLSGRSMVKELPEQRVDPLKSFRMSRDNARSKKKLYGNFIDRPDAFDNEFFGISQREATSMDPQQRLLLEAAYHAIESSGHGRVDTRGHQVGVFIGASLVEYLTNTSSHSPTAYTAMGTLRAFLCGRISHKFGWTGPAEVIDTACSSSLVALNRASKAIQNGECSMALAGGVNVISSLENYLDLGKAGFLSPSGQCKPFDKLADGYCRSEGVGLVVLKSLGQAIKDCDNILGVIASAATNQGGLSPSITVPHAPTQVNLYRNILEQAKLSPHHVTYVEAHGTGTQVGDPLEMASIREVFGGSDRATELSVGSIKGNIGHCETAAGIAGVIKALLLLQKGAIPRLASHTALNPSITDIQESRMTIASDNEPWKVPFRAICVNSYGAAGGNAAALLCQAPPSQGKSVQYPFIRSQSFPLRLSADSKESLRDFATDLEQYLPSKGSEYSLADIAFTLSKRSKRHRFHWTTVESKISGLTAALRKGVETSTYILPEKRKSVVLVFAGQSRQFVGLQKALYTSTPLLRSFILECDVQLVELGFATIIPAIFETKPISNIQVLQCGIFAMQYACARSWIESGLQVSAVIGHSLGELTALAVAGVLSLKDALTLVAKRASLIETEWGNEKGAMLAIHGSAHATQEVISSLPGESLEIACYNSDVSHVLVGPEHSIAEAERFIQSTERFHSLKPQRLNVSHGFHSKLTTDILDSLDKTAASLAFNESRIPIECCTLEKQSQLSHNHASDHARNPVYFVNAIHRLEEQLGSCVWLEADINSSVIPMAKRAVRIADSHSFYPLRFGTDSNPLLPISEVTENLWREGIALDHWTFHASTNPGFEHIWLPPYHFRQTRHWLPSIDHTTRILEEKALESASHDNREKGYLSPKPSLLVTRKLDHQQKQGSEDFVIDNGTTRYTAVVSGHAVLQRSLCPAGMYMECAFMAIYSAQRVLDSAGFSFEDCTFESPLGIDNSRLVSISVSDEKKRTGWSFRIQSSSKEDSRSRIITHGKGRLEFKGKLEMLHYQRLISKRIQQLSEDQTMEVLRCEKVYRLFSRIVNYSTIFRGISRFRVLNNEALADIVIPEQIQTAENPTISICDAVSLDVFLQVGGLLLNCHDSCGDDEVFLAVGVDSVCASLACEFVGGKSWTVYATFDASTDTHVKTDIYVLWPDGSLAVTMMGVQFAKTPIATLQRLLDSSSGKKSTSSIPQAAKSLVPIESMSSESSELTSRSGSQDLAETRQTSRDEMSSLNDIEEDMRALKEILASYVGLSHDQIPNTSTISEMGVDSLAAIELTDGIAARFGRDLSTSDVLSSDVQSLCSVLAIERYPKSSESESPLKDVSSSLVIPQMTGRPNMDTEHQVHMQRAKVMELLSAHCGCSTSTIQERSNLQELGVDSLSRIELKAEMEETFSVEIDDGDFTTETTVDQILNLLCIHSCDSPAPYKEADVVEQHKAPKSIENVHTSGETRVLKDPIDVLADCDQSFTSSATKHEFAGYWSKVAPRQDELLLAYIAEAFRDLGVDLWQMEAETVVPEVQHSAQNFQVMQRLWKILEAFGIVYRIRGQICRTTKSIPKVSSSVLNQQLIDTFPAYSCDAKLMDVTGPKLGPCLCGETNPLSLLFGNAEAKTRLGDFYEHSPMFATLTDHLVTFMKKLLSPSGTVKFRVIEAGAGFGGTTIAVAEELQRIGNVEYTFTDVSPTLVEKAQKTFAKYPWMDFKVLDLEKDAPASLLNKYDMVIATNVVHATSNLVRSVSRMRSLLRPGGFACLSEMTRPLEWHNIVFGLLSGWWSFNDGRTYALQSAEKWMETFQQAGFESMSYSHGQSEEARSQRLLIGSTRPPKIQGNALRMGIKPGPKFRIETMVYKVIDDISIEADVYLPIKPVKNQTMAVALVIHGGGFMTLSKKATRPHQLEYLLANGVIPISIDHRLCPEVNVVDGPMIDVRDALLWAQTEFPEIARGHGININPGNVALIGWSTGGLLAMTTAWTACDAGNQPPRAILNFYGPSDFLALASNTNLGIDYPARTMLMEDIRRSLPTKPITSYDHSGTGDSTNLGWVKPGDPRSELVLSLFKEQTSLNFLLYGISEDHAHRTPTAAEIENVSPIAQLRKGKYNTPTFSVHGERDEIVPCDMSVAFDRELKKRGVESGLCVVKGARHIHDLGVQVGTKMWEKGVGPGYEFLLRKLGRGGH